MKALTLRRGLIIMASTFLLFTTIFISCRKDLKDEQYYSGPFDSRAAKEWYYGVFKKSLEFRSSKETGKKLPAWRHGVYRKVGTTEIVEFPLNRQQYAFSITKTANSNERDLQQIVNGSLSRVSIIKTGTGQVYLREISYIPTLEFLKSKSYDISDVNLGINNSGSFSGRIIIKKWDGSVISTQLMENGNVTKRGKISLTGNGTGTNSTAMGNCEMWEICEYERECTDYYVGDEWIKEECTDWRPTGFCWYEEYCEPEECDYGSSESCECQLYGTGCEGNEEDQSDNCNFTTEEAQGMLESVVVHHPNVIRSEDGPIIAELGQPERKQKTEEWDFYNATIIYGFTVKYTAYFSGVVYRANSSDKWKWEAFSYQNTAKTDGMLPPCVSHDLTVTATTTLISTDKRYANATLSYAATLKIQCLGGWEMKTMKGGPLKMEDVPAE